MTLMANLYNRIQGRNLERLAALSDGIFAVAMTLLVLDLHIPSAAQVHGEGELLAALGALGPQWIAYWHELSHPGHLLGRPANAAQPHRRRHARPHLDSSRLSLRHHALPLSTRLLAEFITYRAALGIYWLNISVPGAMLYWSWTLRHARQPRSRPTRPTKCAAASAGASSSRSRSMPPARPSASSTPGSASRPSCWCS